MTRPTAGAAGHARDSRATAGSIAIEANHAIRTVKMT